jgi:uncharacterized protein YjbI with pentapeptide repeats
MTVVDSSSRDEHVAILSKGVEAWNRWRDANPDVIPHLGQAQLKQADLAGADLRGAYLYGAFLVQANLTQANLAGAGLRGAYLSDANLQEANLAGAHLDEAYLPLARLRRANLAGAHFSRANLKMAVLDEANLHEAYLAGADLEGAHLVAAYLRKANLDRANLAGAHLVEANLHEANLTRANLAFADLRGASLTAARLESANLTQANMAGTDLEGANLRHTVFGSTTLTAVKGLDRCRHIGPSVIDFQTLKDSGPLPIAFVRGVGLPDTLIDYLPSLLNQVIQYYSCFISYSSKDEVFVERLYADLQNKGVRCWLASHDMPIGAKLIDAIDEAIRLRDKVLLILSDGAIASDWVEGEVTRALDEERTRKQVVLFPVRLDDAVMQTSESWAVLLRGQRNIGDFSGWKEHDSYQRGFDRLMRDLRVETSG